MGDQLVARPLPKDKTTQTQKNADTHYISMPREGFEPAITASKRSKAVHASDRSATATGIKLGTYEYNMAPEPISAGCLINTSSQYVLLYAFSTHFARQWLGKKVTKAIILEKIEQLLEASFSMQFVSYQRKEGHWFLTELFAFLSCRNCISYYGNIIDSA
jgi:hypothetical protein